MFRLLIPDVRRSLLSAASRVSDLKDHFQASTEQPTNWIALGLVIGLPLLAAGLIYAVYRWCSRPVRPFFAPDELFNELCRLHQLTNADRQLLLQIAATLQISQPVSLFTNPGLLRTASRRRIGARPAQIQRLHRTLFD